VEFALVAFAVAGAALQFLEDAAGAFQRRHVGHRIASGVVVVTLQVAAEGIAVGIALVLARIRRRGLAVGIAALGLAHLVEALAQLLERVVLALHGIAGLAAAQRLARIAHRAVGTAELLGQFHPAFGHAAHHLAEPAAQVFLLAGIGLVLAAGLTLSRLTLS